MIVARDQFLSWAMMSSRQEDLYAVHKNLRLSFFAARYAIYHCLKLLGIGPGAEVLVPSYICRAAVDPVLACGADAAFYAVNCQCSVDLADIKRKITPCTKALIVVHYFGFPSSLSEIRRLCDTHGIVLIEDCAHVLRGETDGKPLGTIGDAGVFSWRKFLPLYDGAELWLNRPTEFRGIAWTKESPLFTVKTAVNTLDVRFAQARKPLPRLAYGGFRASQTLLRKCVNRRLRNEGIMQVESNAINFDLKSVNLPMSRLSRWTKNHSDLKRVIARRRQNYELLSTELANTNRVRRLFSDLPKTVCPWVFPVMLSGVCDAHLELRRRGIPAVTWGGVRHPKVVESRFADADFLYKNLVFLPIHQCLGQKEIMVIASAVRELCGE